PGLPGHHARCPARLVVSRAPRGPGSAADVPARGGATVAQRALGVALGSAEVPLDVGLYPGTAVRRPSDAPSAVATESPASDLGRGEQSRRHARAGRGG